MQHGKSLLIGAVVRKLKLIGAFQLSAVIQLSLMIELVIVITWLFHVRTKPPLVPSARANRKSLKLAPIDSWTIDIDTALNFDFWMQRTEAELAWTTTRMRRRRAGLYNPWTLHTMKINWVMEETDRTNRTQHNTSLLAKRCSRCMHANYTWNKIKHADSWTIHCEARLRGWEPACGWLGGWLYPQPIRVQTLGLALVFLI